MEQREIKFRGQQVDSKIWIYGDLNHSNGKVFIFNENQNDSADNYEVIKKTVGQFTGLKDKNGKEIYESDIVEIINNRIRGKIKDIGFIEWNDYECGLRACIEKVKHSWVPRINDSSLEFEVIGNISQNPELLK